jgi:hypothetical protein
MVDKIIVMMDGAVSEMGSYDELLSHEGAFAQFLKMYLIQTEDEEEEDPEGGFEWSIMNSFFFLAKIADGSEALSLTENVSDSVSLHSVIISATRLKMLLSFTAGL